MEDHMSQETTAKQPSKPPFARIAFLGAGNMARAIIAGIIASGYPANNITAVNRSHEKNSALQNDFGIHCTDNPLLAASEAEIVVLGVKPQQMEMLFSQLSTLDWQGKTVISLAAGMLISRLEALAGTPLSVIRVMPNTPALVGEGMSGLFAARQVTASQKAQAAHLLQSVGKICWVDTEAQINGIIAAAGSAPAYFFLIMEAMQAEAERQGFSAEVARELIQQTALGAATLAQANSALSFSALREQVTSKGGTTAEALSVFHQAKLPEIVAKAMQAAVQRATEMETQF